MKLKPILFLGLLVVGVTGCVNQHREIAQYRSILNADVDGSVPQLADGESLSLIRALRLANQDNENLMIRGEDFVQAINEKDRAFSNFIPTLTLSPGYTIVDNSEATGTGGGQALGTSGGFKRVGSTLRRFEVPVTGSMNVFRGFRDLASLEASIWSIEQRRQLLLDAQASILLQVAQTYYDVLRFERQVEVLRKSLEAQNERVRDATGRFKAGTGRPLDVAQAQAQEASTQVLLVQAQGDVVNARNLLAFLIGAPRVTGRLQDEYQVPSDVGQVDALVSRALATREDYKAATNVVEAATANVRAAIGEYYPSVSLNITGYLFRENFEDASKWNSLLSVSLPIFSAGVIEADVRTAWSRLRQAALEQSLLQRQIEQEVRQQYQSFQTSAAKLAELGVQIKASAEAYRQSRAGFDAGTAIFLDVLTAQNDLLNSELELATEEFNLKVLYLQLLRSQGVLRIGNVIKAPRATTGPSTQPTTAPAGAR